MRPEMASWYWNGGQLEFAERLENSHETMPGGTGFGTGGGIGSPSARSNLSITGALPVK
jgi:hypothetical protein